MYGKKAQICRSLEAMAQRNRSRIENLSDAVRLTDYTHLVRGENIWTDALQAALDEHETVIIPACAQPYLIDGTITIPSNRHIEAEEGAVIRQAEGVQVLMLRNEHTQDGTHQPISRENRDENISIRGGRWEESYTGRAGYGRSGMYDMQRSFFGVSTCFLFNNMDGLTLENLTFVNTAGFSVQMGDVSDVVAENIEFVKCFADGLHINGNTENLLVRNVYGQVGDDLVALNMYDWQNSSVNFGPMHNVLVEKLDLSEDSRYKAMRIEPGMYYYDDGSQVDCSLTDAIIRHVRGINTFKLYYQTPSYYVETDKPERGDVGSGNDIFFEDIEIDLNQPVDPFDEYLRSDPVKGSFAGFEINANIGRIFFENIRLTRYDRFPMSFLIAVGPKSVRTGSDGKWEIFDPYLSSEIGQIHLKDIQINGQRPAEIRPYVREIVFDHLYEDAPSTASGRILSMTCDGQPV